MKYYLVKLTIYNFNKKKIKFDYSFIPVEKPENKKDSNAVEIKSLVSNEKAIIYNYDFEPINSELAIYKPYYVHKDAEGHKISRVLILFSCSKDLTENDSRMVNRSLYEYFMKHFWYKPKHKKALKERVARGQFEI